VAGDAMNLFGEFLDALWREFIVVTKNDLLLGKMISIEDAAGTLNTCLLHACHTHPEVVPCKS